MRRLTHSSSTVLLLVCSLNEYAFVGGDAASPYNSVLALFERIITSRGSLNTPLPSFFEEAEKLTKKQGYKFEKHNVITEDSYILELHHVWRQNSYDLSSTLDRGPPVLLMHGFLGVSDTFLLRNTSLAFMLADEGYDVWLPNSRGTWYSKQHRYLNNTRPEFWDYSIHEVGIYDIPASIDFILASTGWPKLFYVGFSMGNTAFFITTSMRPDYNDKIILAVAMPPVASSVALEDALTPFTRLLILNIDKIYSALNSLNFNELVPRVSEVISLMYYAVSDYRTRPLCLAVYSSLAGEHYDNIIMDTIADESTHFPAGTSLLEFYHQVSILKKGFKPLNYGSEKNLVKYNSTTPPNYSLKATTSPVAIFYSDNDPFVSMKGARSVIKSLPNVVYTHQMPTRFNHIDYILGRDSSVEQSCR